MSVCSQKSQVSLKVCRSDMESVCSVNNDLLTTTPHKNKVDQTRIHLHQSHIKNRLKLKSM